MVWCGVVSSVHHLAGQLRQHFVWAVAYKRHDLEEDSGRFGQQKGELHESLEDDVMDPGAPGCPEVF